MEPTIMALPLSLSELKAIDETDFEQALARSVYRQKNPQSKINRKKYQRSPKGRAAKLRYNQSGKGLLVASRASKKYQQSPKGIAKRKERQALKKQIVPTIIVPPPAAKPTPNKQPTQLLSNFFKK